MNIEYNVNSTYNCASMKFVYCALFKGYIVMEGTHLKMLETYNSKEIQGCLQVISSTLDFKLSDYNKAAFLYFHNFITNPQPKFITDWREDARKEHWYHKFVNGILGEVQNSLSCVLYHCENMIELERTVFENLEQFSYREKIGDGTTIGIGSTLKWDFEYQAFILSYRRCLDYLTRAICAYFQNDVHSFRKLGEYLAKIDRVVVTEPIIQVHAKYCSEFEFVLSEGNRKSLRDQISHYAYVPVGVLNLSNQGVMLVGGGENLQGFDGVKLSHVLEKRIEVLCSCVREMIYTLVNAISDEQSQAIIK